MTEEDAVAIEIEEEIDLHGFRPSDLLDVVQDYLEAASEKGLREVRLVHGKGTGYQRARVQRLLKTHPLVASFADAPPTRGGWGATIVRLVVPLGIDRDAPPQPGS